MSAHIEMRTKETSLTPARLAWIVFALTLVVIQIASQIAAWREMQNISLTPEQIQGLQAMGLTIEFYAAWRFIWQIPLPLFWGGLGFLIFLRRSNDRAALVVSTMMLGLGLGGSVPLWTAFANVYPEWIGVVVPVAFVSNLCLNSFFAVFPTGNFVPRWTVVAAVVLSALNIVNSYDFALPPSLRLGTQTTNVILPIFIFASLALYVFVPMYRYRWHSKHIEREQIKWVVSAVSLAFALFAITASTVFWAPNSNPKTDISFITVFVQIMGWSVSVQLIPIAIGISILRYRLFDIDILIRRTLIYSVLTALLALFYFGSVIILQQIFRSMTGAGDDLAIIISTLAIAALFNSLRRRVQDTIDHRFYRRKYDTQQVLARFATTLRDEVELEKLTAELVNVVSETMQPTSVSLWLKKTDDRRLRVEG